MHQASWRSQRGTWLYPAQVGGVVVGHVPSIRVDSQPYGGVKDSGLGREGIRYAMKDMTEERVLLMADVGTGFSG